MIEIVNLLFFNSKHNSYFITQAVLVQRSSLNILMVI